MLAISVFLIAAGLFAPRRACSIEAIRAAHSPYPATTYDRTQTMQMLLQLGAAKLFPELAQLSARLQPYDQILDSLTAPLRTDRASELSFDFDSGAQRLPEIALRGDLKISLGGGAAAHGRLALVPPGVEWPAWVTQHAWIVEHGALAADQALVVAEMRGQASAQAGASAPLGHAVVRGELGAEAGSTICLVGARRFPFTAGATNIAELTASLLSELAWPDANDGGALAVALMPPGSGVAMEFTGTVKLAAAVSGGIEYEFFREFSVRGLTPSVKARVECLARVAVAQTLGGRYRLIVSGENRGTTRVRVAHGRESHVTGAVAVDVAGDWQIENLPASPWDLLDAMLGVDTDAIQRWLAVAADPRCQNWDAVKKELGARFGALAPKLLEKYLGEQIANVAASESFAKVQKLAAEASRRVQELDDRRNRLLRKYSDRLDELQQWLTAIDQAIEPQAEGTLASWLGNVSPETWALLGDLLGDDIDLLAVQNGARDWLRKEIEPLRTQLADRAGAATENAAKLITDLVAATDLEKLQEILTVAANPQQLTALANAKLVALAETLFGEAIDVVPAAQANALVQRLHAGAQKVQDVVRALEAKLKEAYQGKFSLHAALELSRYRGTEALFDVEFAPGGDGARAPIFAAALRGDFGALADSRPAAGVIINTAEWQRTLKRQSRLSFRGFGQDFLSISGLEQISRAQLAAGGSLIVFSSETQATYARECGGESFATAMVMKAAAQLTRGAGATDAETTHALAALSELTLETKVAYDDRATTRAELEDYLEYAEAIELIDSAAALAEALYHDFPDMKRAAVRYRTFINAAALREFFSRKSGADIAEAVRTALRPIYAATHRRARRRANLEFDVETYLRLRAVTRTRKRQGGWRYQLTYLDGRSEIATDAKSVDWDVFDLWLDGEREATDVLSRVDAAIDALRADVQWTFDSARRQWNELDAAVERLLKLSTHMGFLGLPRLRNPWADNVFFVLLDQLFRSVQAQEDLPQSLIIELYGADDAAPALRRLITSGAAG